MTQSPPIKHALISVSDKQGLEAFAAGLRDAGVTIYSTGGTRKFLADRGFAVLDVAEYTGFPEMMDGRVKTLHPKIFAGILCRHDRADDQQALKDHAISTFELVVVNLYPFEKTVANPDVADAEAIEQIDIGGPSLVRASAKNHAFTTIVTDLDQYDQILAEIRQSGTTTLATRRACAARAFARTAAYDAAISAYFAQTDTTTESPFPRQWQWSGKLKATLRYGENPHQRAALYRTPAAQHSLVDAQQLHGKELSYNNYLDLDAAWSIARSLPDHAAVVIKHTNPCGAASDAVLSRAAEKAMAGDPQSAFGSVLGFNQVVDAATAEVLAAPGLFIEAIVAPDFEPAALEILTTRPKWKANVRLMKIGSRTPKPRHQWHMRQVDGGMLVQDLDCDADRFEDWNVVTETTPSDQLLTELRFAWALVRHVKSNAIVVCRDLALAGAGAGQMSRVDSVQIAIEKAGDRRHQAVLASDAFFPFADSIEHAAKAGIAAIIQPGGSVNDKDVVAACNHHGLPMVITGRRHFKH